VLLDSLRVLRALPTRAFKRSATKGETNGATSPPRDAISLTKREAMNWCLFDAMRNTVSI